MSVVGRHHSVRQGECLSRIATAYGFTNYRTIYDHPQNAEFRRRRPDPNIIYPGDRLYIPDPDERVEPRSTGQRHRFETPLTTRTLRVAAEDPCWHRLANEAYELRVDGQIRRGTTDGQGLLEEEIPFSAETARLSVGDYTWELSVGHLNPVDRDTPDRGVSGAQGRLLNLGYDVGPVDGDLGPRTEAALRQFQANEEIEVTGDLDDATRAKLVEVHGC